MTLVPAPTALGSVRTTNAADDGWVAGMAVITVTVLMLLAAVTTTSVETSAAVARRDGDGLVAREAALAGAELFYAAVNAVPSATWIPACTPGGGASSCGALSDLFPASLSEVAGGRWVELQGGAVVPCQTGVPATGTCIDMHDRVEFAPGATPRAPLSDVSLQVDAMTNCRRGSWRNGAVPDHCVYARVLERFTPRQYVDYLDYTGSELLDPALAVDDGASYPAWLGACTTESPPEPIPDSEAAAGRSHLCPTPAYLGAGTVAGAPTVSPGDALDGPVATNDQTVFACNSAGAPPAADDIEAVGATPSEELPAAATDPGPSCPGPAPAGQTVPASPPPPDTSALAGDALAADRFGTATAPVDLTLTLVGSSAGTSGYRVGAGPVRPWPAAGVLYVYGTVSVSGESCLPLTIGASDAIDVVGNLFRPTSCPHAVTGLVAGTEVTVVPALIHNQVACWPQPVDGQCMTVEAAVMALGSADLPDSPGLPDGGSFNLAGWDVDASPLGSGDTCRYDQVVAADGASDDWPLTGSAPGSVQWSGTGNDDTGTTTGEVHPAAAPGPLACRSGATGLRLSPVGPSGQGYLTSPVEVDTPDPVSVAAWFESGPNGGGPVVALGDAHSPLQGTISTNQIWVGARGGLFAGARDAAGATVMVSSPPGTDVADGRWHLAVATFGPAGVTLSLDGRRIATGTTGVAPATGYWWIGAMRAAGWPVVAGTAQGVATYDGALGQVAVFPHAFDVSEVAGLFNAGQQDPNRCAGVNVCALVFDGSFYERFRGAFGTYDTTISGPDTDTGILKRFTFDRTLGDDTPPDFFGPVSGGWLRSGASVTGALGP